MIEAFEAKEYLIRRKILTLLGAKFHIFSADGRVIGFSKQKAFKLKEDIRIYTDESMAEERLLIKARQVIDFSAAYDVVDPAEGTKVGALRRKGFSSLVRDSWEFLDVQDNPIGKISEDSLLMATGGWWLVALIPQNYTITAGGEQEVGSYRQSWNPFVYKLSVDIRSDQTPIDPRLVLAGGVLLAAIEGKQKQ